MCGIVGQAFREGRCNPEILMAMRDSIAHRGPDDAGGWYSPDSRVGMAHRRLAIIDLSPRGRQPMSFESGKLFIVFNGEIYNFLDLRQRLEKMGHSFRSMTDTEVILGAYRVWGTDCLRELNGMFAFCIYDDDRRIFFLARDRAGEKPLYYRYSPGEFSFASELKALMADPGTQRKLNLEAVNHYLAYGYVPAPMSILQGVEKLPQAHALVYDIDNGSLRSWKYWDLPEPDANSHASIEDLCSEFESLLRDAIRRQLVSDVPLGILLSGGCDSSLVTALASEVSQKSLRTFTVSFHGYPQYDEAPFARIVASHFGTEHTQITIGDEPPVDVMEELAAQFDEPLADHAIIPTYLISKAIRQHATVALSGDGGDELFGGYPHYAALLKLAQFRRFVPFPIRSFVAGYASRFLQVGTRYRNHVIGFRNHFGSVAHVNLYFDEYSRKQLLNREITGAIDLGLPERQRVAYCLPSHSPLRQAMQADFMSTLADGYLVKVDRASMLTSLEVRAPFLDYRMIEFAFRSVPDRYKVAGGQLKILPRYAARSLLPASLNLDRKQGFTMPISHWFKGRWGRFIQSVLNDAGPGLFDGKFISKLFDRSGGINSNTNRLFALTIFELWRKIYGIKI